MRFSRSVGSLLALGIVFSGLTANAQSPIQVGKNVQVSIVRKDQPHYEVVLAADPKDPKKLLAGSMVIPKGPSDRMFDVSTYASFDGGATWQETGTVVNGWQAGDPTCAYGPDGQAYLTALGVSFHSPKEPSKMLFYRSMDGGKTWAEPVTLPVIDREYVTVDNSSSKYRGHIYINGTGAVKAFGSQGIQAGEYTDFDFFSSTDGGATFHPPLKLAEGLENHWIFGMGNGVVLSDGTFVAITGDMDKLDKFGQTRPYQANGRILTVASRDGGVTLEQPVRVSDWYIAEDQIMRGATVPFLAVDSSEGPFKDRLYCVWADVRSGRSEIMMSMSSDKGKSWSRPITVNDDRARADITQGPDNGMCAIAVNDAGVVGVMWYDRRDNPDDLSYYPRFSASTDGGETFTPSVRISEAPSTLDRMQKIELASGAGSSGGGSRIESSRGGNIHFGLGLDGFHFSGGHTDGLVAAADGTFHALWVDNRTGITQVWTAPITVQGKAMHNGTADLSGYTDESSKVSLEFNGASYDRSTHVLSIDAYLVNTSSTDLSGPLKLRAISITSKMGALAARNSDNGAPGAGAVWDLTGLLDGGVLKAGETSHTAKHLEFQISDISPDADKSPDAWLGMLSVEAKLLGKEPAEKEKAK